MKYIRCDLVWRTCWSQQIIKLLAGLSSRIGKMITVAHDLAWLKEKNAKRFQQAIEMCLCLLYLNILSLFLYGMSSDGYKLELCVPALSSVIAAHSSLTTEVRQPPSPSLALSLPVSLCVSLSLSPLSPLYLSHSSLWSMPGTCAVGAGVFGCVFVSVQLRLWTCYHVYCVCSAPMACVCVCANQIGRALISHAVLSLNWRAVYDRGWC